ncbi:aspartyl-phosphate phosphatase Spo0E family protein [Ferdinandcohnia sp. SAFN-114]|uniref:aspartyl-phosphate phosphatase Spo0E family protein n=1 Tax=Ferdinandcohnia sp. SAFN-114 TaxID=3387275 RepID=UPI003F7E9DF6
MKGKIDVRLIELLNKIEEKRIQMIEIALKKGLSSKETVEISHQLDKLLMAYHKRKYKLDFNN